jgi:hypothetical protein
LAKTGENKRVTTTSNKKEKTEGWVSPSTAGETQRSLLSWSVTSCSTTLARLPRLPSLALCLLAAAPARGSAREAEGGREEWLRCARASDGERTTKSESTAAASFKLRLRHRRNRIVVSFNVSHIALHWRCTWYTRN